MQPKQLTVMCQAVVSCALWICGLQMLHPPAPAQTGKEAESRQDSKNNEEGKESSGRRGSLAVDISGPGRRENVEDEEAQGIRCNFLADSHSGRSR